MTVLGFQWIVIGTGLITCGVHSGVDAYEEGGHAECPEDGTADTAWGRKDDVQLSQRLGDTATGGYCYWELLLLGNTANGGYC